MAPPTIPDQLRSRAATDGDAVAVAVAGRRGLTYGEWSARSAAAARGLARRGVGAGDRVALLFDEERWIDYAVAYLAVLEAGAVAVPFDCGWPLAELRRAWLDAGVAGVVGVPDGGGLASEPAWAADLAELEQGSGGTDGATGAAGATGATTAELLYVPGVMRRPEARARSHADALSARAGWPAPRTGVPPVLVHAFVPGSTAGQEAIRHALAGGRSVSAAAPGLDGAGLLARAAEHGATVLGLPPALAASLLDTRGGDAELPPVAAVVVAPPPSTPGLLARVAEAWPAATVLTAGEPRPAGAVPGVPAAVAQEGIVWREQLAPGSTNPPPLVHRFRGQVQKRAMEAALGELVLRHSALRTTFEVAGGHARQRVAPFRPFRLPVVDIADLAPAEKDEALARFFVDARSRPFDLVNGPLFDPGLIHLGADDDVLVVRAHRAVFDESSVGVLHRDLAALYAAFVEAGSADPDTPPVPPEPSLQFSEVSARQAADRAGPRGSEDREFWARRLAGAPLAVQLPVGDPARPPGSPQPAAPPVVVELGPEPARAVRALARAERATPFVVLLAAFAALVERYTGQDDLLVSTMAVNRSAADAGVIGCFADQVPVRLAGAGERSFVELVALARESLMAALAHAAVGQEAAVAGALGASAAVHGLVPHLAVELRAAGAPPDRLELCELEAADLDPALMRAASGAPPGPGPAGPGGRTGPAGPGGRTGPAGPGGGAGWGGGLYLGTLVSVSVADAADGGLTVTAEGAFDVGAVRRLLDDYLALLIAVLADPSAKVALWTAPAPVAAPAAGAASDERMGADAAVATWARRAPEREAVRFEGRRLTYGELDARVDALTARLAASGVGEETPVGVCVQPSVEAVVAVLAIWRAGGAVVALDPDDVEGRRALAVDDSGLATVVADRELAGALRQGRPGLQVLSPIEDAAPQAVPARAPSPAPAALAAIWYGSAPFGVALERGTLAELWHTVRHELYGRRAEGDLRVAAPARPTDATFLRQLAALVGGHQLHLERHRPGGDRDAVLAALADGGVDVVECEPGELHALVSHGLEKAVATRAGRRAPAVAVVGDEPVGAATWAEWRAIEGLDLAWLHGSPEAGLAAGAGTDGRSARVVEVVGRPGQRVPVGAVGELVVAGEALARGYWRRPGETAAAFGCDPARAGGRRFATGQLARRLPGGDTEILGPAADHADLRGFLVDLRRVEAALATCAGVADVAVVADHSGADGPRLVACLVPDGPRPPDVDRLRRHLWSRLPGYAWPAAVVPVESVPRDRGGDVDRAALAAGLGAATPPTTPGSGLPEARLLAAAWAEASASAAIDSAAPYWHSFSFLEALPIAARAGLAVPPGLVSRNRTVAALATALAARRPDDVAALPADRPAPPPRLPATPARSDAATDGAPEPAPSVAAGNGGVEEVIRTEGLTKVYPVVGDDGPGLVAVDHLDLAVHKGEIFGLLGPNGAGKTTTVGMLTTRVLPSAGRATVAGIDVVAQPARTKRCIGVVHQGNTLDRSLTVWENLYFHGRYFGMSAKGATAAADAALERFRLTARRRAEVRVLSGGMARRLMVARALMHEPAVVFLDEPTAGLDPQSRLALWDILGELHDAGQTILLTTHYMEEADRFCDRVAIVDHGRVLALDTPSHLKAAATPKENEELIAKARLARLRALARMAHPGQLDALLEHLETDMEMLEAVGGPESLGELLGDDSGATLESVFIDLTGRDLRE